MVNFRAYIIGSDGLFVSALGLDCADDPVAIEAAMQFVDGHDVEVWQHERKAAQLSKSGSGVELSA